jgi:hypothetical protein
MNGNSSPLSILALDLSASRTGIAEGIAGQVPRLYSMSWQRDGDADDHCDVLQRLGLWLIERFKADRPDVFVIEAPVNPGAFIGKYDEEKGKVRMTTNPDTTMLLFELIGAVKLVGAMRQRRPVLANVQTVRKAFLGQARPSDPKRHAQTMCRHLGWTGPDGRPVNTDEADAAAVWWWATMKHSPRFYTPISPMTQQRVATEAGAAAVPKPRKALR